MEQFTSENLKKLIEEVKNKPIIYMNSRTNEAVLQRIDFKPTNIEINNYIPDNQAIVFTKEQMDKMQKGFFKY